MTFTFEAYDWSSFWLTATIVTGALVLLGAIVAYAIDDAVPVFVMFLFGVSISLLMFSSHLRAEKAYLIDAKVEGITSLGYSDPAEANSGYNQWVASNEDGEFVKLVLTLVETDTYLVTETQE